MHRSLLQVALVLLLAGQMSLPMAARELLDRIAITVGLQVITEQEIYEQVRIAAFLEGVEPAFTQPVLRETADRMVMQRLLLLDMRANGFPMPTEEELDAALLNSKQEHWGSEEAFDQATLKQGLDPMAIRQFLRSAVATVRYCDCRFRPSVRVSDAALLELYLQRFPEGDVENSPQPPPLEEVRDALEEELREEAVNRNIERWLEDARSQAAVRYLPEVLP